MAVFQPPLFGSHLRKRRVFKYTLHSAIFMLCMLPLVMNAQLASGSVPSASMTLSKQYSSQGISLMVNEYVSYDLSIRNTSDMPIENESLWLSFVSKGGITSVHTTFKVPIITPDETAVLHLGPFKMRESGEHELYVGMNRMANPSLQNDIFLNRDPTVPIDSFRVNETITIQDVIMAALFSTVGSIAILAYFRKKKASRGLR